MKKVVLTGFTVLCLLFTLLMGLTLHTQSVGASGTIYIRADGSVDPPTAPIYTADNATYTLTGDIQSDADGVVVERSNITIDGNGYTLQGVGSGQGLALNHISNVTVENINIKNFSVSIWLDSAFHIIISQNNMTDCDGAIFLFDSTHCTLSSNNITKNSGDYTVYLSNSRNNTIEQNLLINNQAHPIIFLLDGSSYNFLANNLLTVDPNPKGIMVDGSNYNVIAGNTIKNASGQAIWVTYGSSNNQISGNTIKNNVKGIEFWSSNNIIFHNNFINNSQQVSLTPGCTNIWDDGDLGNYWSDYAGTDVNGDGTGDFAYFIDENNTDYYPLMHPWSSLPVHNINTGLGYATIQATIDANETLNGHTIFAEAGTYHGNIIVDKAISLVGEDKAATVLNGNKTGTVVRIVSNNVAVTGFTIQNGYSGVVLDYSNFSVITGNTVLNNQFYGIECYRSDNNVIENNVAFNNSRGIKIYYSNYTKLIGNNASTNWYGLRIRSSANNTLRNNTMTGNHWNFAIDADYLSELTHDIDASNTVDGKPIIYWIDKHDQHVPTNAGFVAAVNCSGITVKNANLVRNNIGVLLWSTSNSTIEKVKISDNWVGAALVSSEKIKLFKNTISNSAEEGIIVVMSNNSRVIKNNFVNNGYQINTYKSFNNSWDDGYPSGGNYWSDYNGTDSDGDGIGDTPYQIDINNTDNYPLVGMFSSFNTSLDKFVNVVSNSTIKDFQYFRDNSTIKMFVSSMTTNQTCGFCRVTIPHALMNVTSIEVIVDNGTTPLLYHNYTLHNNGTHRWIYFSYPHSTHEIDIIPEFPSFLVLPLFVIATLLTAIVYRRKLKTRPRTL